MLMALVEIAALAVQAAAPMQVPAVLADRAVLAETVELAAMVVPGERLAVQGLPGVMDQAAIREVPELTATTDLALLEALDHPVIQAPVVLLVAPLGTILAASQTSPSPTTALLPEAPTNGC